MKSIVVFIIVLSFAFTLHAAVAFAQIDVSCTNNSTYPWCGPTTNLGQLVRNFYTVALQLAGGAAFGVIVYGAVRRMTAAGSPSGINDANEWITGALLGVVLLFGAYLILNTINPELRNLRDIAIMGGLPGGGWDVSACPMEDRNYRYKYAGKAELGLLGPRCSLDDPEKDEADVFARCFVGDICWDWTKGRGGIGIITDVNFSRKFEFIGRVSPQ